MSGPPNNEVELYERDYSQDPEILRQSLDPLLLNRGCSNFTGSGVSLADLDGDGDLDAVFGADGAPLHVFEHTPSGWRSAGPTGIDSDSIPLDAIPLDSADPSNPSFRKNLLRPVLADWDLDGDLDLALLHDNGLRGGNRYFEHQSDGTVREINDTHLSRLNANCSMNWRVGFSFVDFDGDGAKDLVGFDRNFNVIICVRTSSGFEMVSAERDPFYWGPRQNASCFLKYGDRCPWDNDYPFGWFGIMGFPSFLDWDGDGDVDMLRINAANQVGSQEGFRLMSWANRQGRCGCCMFLFVRWGGHFHGAKRFEQTWLRQAVRGGYIYIYIYIFLPHTHNIYIITHTHTHTYIYIYIHTSFFFFVYMYLTRVTCDAGTKNGRKMQHGISTYQQKNVSLELFFR